jgi:uncharacterized integral membrane protein
MRFFTYLFLILILILGVTFAVLNHEPVKINYYLGEQSLPLSLLLVLSFISGSFLGLCVGLWILFKTKLANYRLQHQLKVAEKEVQNLRAIPLQDRH